MALKSETLRNERPSSPIVLTKTNSVKRRMGSVCVMCQGVLSPEERKGTKTRSVKATNSGRGALPPKRTIVGKTTHARCERNGTITMKVIVRAAQARTSKSFLMPLFLKFRACNPSPKKASRWHTRPGVRSFPPQLRFRSPSH